MSGEGIDVKSAKILAAQCPGDGVHSELRDAVHDWRLWERKWVSFMTANLPACWEEVWYCTRCRKIEERFSP